MVSKRRETRSTTTPRPLAVWLYLLGAVVLGISALFGGVVLMWRRADDPLGLPLEWLEDTPFRDYFVPGVTLFGVFGIGSLVVVIGVLRRRSWAGIASVALGVAQVVWIGVEVCYLRMIHPLHVAYGGLGAVLATLAARPSMREYLRGR